MNLFAIVKAEVTVIQAAERYGIKISRNNMICCPFHNDKHPSMKLNDRYYFCFGCGASGDVIHFVAKLFGMTNYDAAKKLAYDFGINPDKPPTCAALKPQVWQVEDEFKQDLRNCQRVLFAYLHLLKDWKVKYAPKDLQTVLDERYVEACQMLSYVETLADALIGEPEYQTKAVELLKKSDTIIKLEERIKREEKHNGKKYAA